MFERTIVWMLSHLLFECLNVQLFEGYLTSCLTFLMFECLNVQATTNLARTQVTARRFKHSNSPMNIWIRQILQWISEHPEGRNLDAHKRSVYWMLECTNASTVYSIWLLSIWIFESKRQGVPSFGSREALLLHSLMDFAFLNLWISHYNLFIYAMTELRMFECSNVCFFK